MCLYAPTSTLADLIKDASPFSTDLASPAFTVKAAATLLGRNMRK